MEKSKTNVQSTNVKNDFNAIANDVNVAQKVSTNVESKIDVISEKSEKTKVNVSAKKMQNSLKNKVEILVNVLQNTEEGKNYLNLSGCKIEDVTVENIKNIYSNIIFKNDKKQFFKFVKLSDNNLLLREDVKNVFDTEIDRFELAYNEKNQKFMQILNSDKILFNKNGIDYTIKIVETLSYIEVLNRIKSYKAQKLIFENRIKNEKEKSEEVQKIDLSKLTLDELIAMKKAEMEKTTETSDILKAM